MPEPIRWGILGTGWIAHRFAEGLAELDSARLVGIGSRTKGRADAFGDEFQIPNRHASYESLVEDPQIDVVYVGTPHVTHKEHALLALRAGKPVLCEKPFTLNAPEAEVVIREARETRLFLMEAMWTRFVPAIVKLRELIAERAIGDLRLMTADVGWRQEYDPESRLYSPSLGGGALLDVGVYPVSLASMLFGRPERFVATAQLAPTGVDAQCAVILAYESGALATFVATLPIDTPRDALVVGTKGWIRIHGPMTDPEALSISRAGGTERILRLPHLGNGYAHQAIEVMQCLRNGCLESAAMPLDETLSVLQTLDAIRARLDLRYPGESQVD